MFHSYIHDIIRFAPRMMKRTPAMSPNEHLSPIAGQFPRRLAHGCSSMFIPKYQDNYTQRWHVYCHDCCLLLVMVTTVAVHIYHCCYCYPYCFLLDRDIYIYTHTHIYIQYIHIYSIYSIYMYIYNMYTAIIVIMIVSIYIVNIWSLLAHLQLSEVSAIMASAGSLMPRIKLGSSIWRRNAA